MTFGETNLQNKSNSKRRTFRMGECQLEEVQHFVHVGIELHVCSYLSSNHRTKSVCNKAHAIMASLTNIGVKSDALNPIVANSLWNKIRLSSILYGSEVWYGMTKTEALMLDKVQTRKLKQMQSLPQRTHDALVIAMVKQYPVITIIDIKKMYFLCKFIHSTGVTKQVFVHRLYDKILSVSNKGFVPEICVILCKYGIIDYLLTYVHGGQFPTRICWKEIVKEAVANHESDRCNKFYQINQMYPYF